MKSISIFLVILASFTFRACDHEVTHPDMELSLSPTYSEGVLYLTPVLTYHGEEDLEIQYGSSIAWIELLEQGDDIIFEYEEQYDSIDHRSNLEEEDERVGQTVTIEVEPGHYDVTLVAEYFMEDADLEEPVHYEHRIVQTIEVTR